MKVYIAGSTAGAEIDRARRWKQRLELFGVQVISTWIDVVGQHGANPREAPLQQRQTWAELDLDQIWQVDLFWFLVPPIEHPSRGAWFEFGAAWAKGISRPTLYASGDTQQSIFCGLAHREFPDDVDAFIEIIDRASKDPPT